MNYSLNLSIVIISYNTKELLRKCLESVVDCLEKSKIKGEVIVVDNASGDGSVEMVKEFRIPRPRQAKPRTVWFMAKRGGQNSEFRIKLIENRENLGFAKAVNQGIRKATGEYIFLLNPDTEVKPEALEKLIQFAKNHPEAGMVGAKLLNPNNSIQASVYHFPALWRAIAEYWLGRKRTYEKYAPPGNEPVEVEAVTGAAMLIPRRTIEKIGFLDERYFMYFEDLDYCRRVKRASLKVYYLPQAEIIHHHGASGQTISTQTRRWLIESSKIYNGIIKYWLLFFIIWSGQKLHRVLRFP